LQKWYVIKKKNHALTWSSVVH